MKALFICFAAVSMSFSTDFNFSIYKQINIDSIIAISKAQTNNDTAIHSESKDSNDAMILPVSDSNKFAIKAIVDKLPKKNKKEISIFEIYLKAAGIPTPPQVSYSMVIKNEKETKLIVTIEDVLVNSITQELKIGDSVTFYCLHYYNFQKLPGLLVCEFKKEKSK
jgi:hypothetical protein